MQQLYKHRAQTQRAYLSRVPRRFTYDPLDASTSAAIRVVSVLPTLYSGNDPLNGAIQCSIQHVTMDVGFIALSYVWGPCDDDRIILLDGHTFRVRSNLWQFLSYARTDCSELPFWIDAICINQDDVDEKNRQVQMMSKIYSNAKAVVAWLGHYAHHADHTIRQLQAYLKTIDEDRTFDEWMVDDDFWIGLEEIMQAEYWRRGWTIQEFVFPARGFLAFGGQWIPMNDLEKVLRRLGEVFMGSTSPGHGHRVRTRREQQLTWLHNSTAGFNITNRTTIRNDDWATTVLLMSNNRFTADVRDRVYSILSLSNRSAALRVDYELNPFQLFLESLSLSTGNAGWDTASKVLTFLNLTPTTIASYSEVSQLQTSGFYTRNPVIGAPHIRELHLRSAASPSAERIWQEACSDLDGRNTTTNWTYLIPSGRLLTLHAFPPGAYWTAHLHHACAENATHLIVAVYSFSPRNATLQAAFLTHDEESSLLRGVYTTRCTSASLKVLFILRVYPAFEQTRLPWD